MSSELIHGKSVTELAAMLNGGQITCVQLCRYYVERCTQLNGSLRAVICVSPTWQQDAQACDDARKHGKAGSSALYGIPVGVKDNIDAEGMPTSAGSLALKDNMRGDAALVKQLKAEGAVVLCKLNLTEWANFRSSESITAWSPVGGQCRNPWALDRTPSSYGSSGGSAAAVAAGLVPVAVGAETEGSLTIPGSNCGVVSFKPTVGMVPRTGLAYVSPWQDTAGPMGTTVTDVANLLQVMQSVDAADEATTQAPEEVRKLLSKPLQANSLQGVRIGVIRNIPRYRSSVLSLFTAALHVLKDAGAECVDVELPEDDPSDPKNEHNEAWWFAEMKHLMDQYLSSTDSSQVKVWSVADLIEFNKQCAEERLDWFGQDRLEGANKAVSIDDNEEYAKSVKARESSSHLHPIDKVMQQHQLAALVAPTANPAGLIDQVAGDHYITNCCTPPAVAGYPHLTVPMGQVGGMPIGLSIMAGRWQDATVLNLGYAYEQRTKYCKVVETLRPSAAFTPL